MWMTTQPAQSSHFNICELVILNSLQKRTDNLNKRSWSLYQWLVWCSHVEENPKDTISINCGHLFANYNEYLKYHGNDRYKSPHAGVRENFSFGEPLGTCRLSYLNCTSSIKRTQQLGWYKIINRVYVQNQLYTILRHTPIGVYTLIIRDSPYML